MQHWPWYLLIDESFLGLGGMQGLCKGDLAAYGAQIRQRIAQWVGLPVCVGIASTKTLAKFANHLAKKHPKFEGVCDWAALSPGEKDAWMAEYEVNEVWGVGRRIAKRLEAMNIRTVQDLRCADSELIRRRFSVVLQKTVQELNGVSCLPLDLMAQDKQQILSSRSFGKPVFALKELEEAVSTYICQAAQRLRDQGSVAGAVTVSIRTNPFKETTPQYGRSHMLALAEPTADSRVLTAQALAVLKQLFRPGFEYHKAAVMLSDLQPKEQRQGCLWEDAADTGQREKTQKLMATLDGINQRFGRGSLQLGAVGIKPVWTMKRGRVSPRYTTRWEDIPKVKAF